MCTKKRIDLLLCMDCGVDTIDIREYYMVDWDVWEEAVASPENFDARAYYFTGEIRHKGILCIGCLEDRLGRELTSEDFLNAPVNDSKKFYHSERLKSRLHN